MELVQLIQFLKVAETEHMTKAAQELHISQPSLSGSIKRLEEELGVPLFDRVGRVIRLNEYGRILERHASVIAFEADSATAEIGRLRETQENHVTIFAPAFLTLPRELLSDMFSICPNISVLTGNATEDTLYSTLSDKKADFAFTSFILPERTEFEHILLSSGPLYILVPEDHPLANRESIRLADTAVYEYASYPEGTPPYQDFIQMCTQAGFTPTIRQQCRSIPDFKNAGEFNGCISLIGKPAYSTYQNIDLKLVPLTDPFCRINFYLCYRKKKHLSRSAKAVMQAIRRYYETASGSIY